MDRETDRIHRWLDLLGVGIPPSVLQLLGRRCRGSQPRRPYLVGILVAGSPSNALQWLDISGVVGQSEMVTESIVEVLDDRQLG